MHVRLGRLCGLAAGVLLLGIWAGAPTSAGAADVVTGCTTADPPPQVLDVAATDVVVRRELARVPGFQDVQLTMRNACGGRYEYQGCAFDPPRPCVGTDVRMRRTADAGPSHRRYPPDGEKLRGELAGWTRSVHPRPLCHGASTRKTGCGCFTAAFTLRLSLWVFRISVSSSTRNL